AFRAFPEYFIELRVRSKPARSKAKVARPGRGSEPDGFVHLSALRAPGPVHVRVIRIHIAAATAAKDVVLAGAGLEATPAQFGIDRDGGARGEQDHDVSED